MRNKLLLFTLLTGAFTALTGCGGSDGPGTEPERGKITVQTAWPNETPSQYTLNIGGKEVVLRGANTQFEHELAAGNYHYNIYNKASGITISGTLATVTETGGYAVSPDWFYAADGDVDVQESGDASITATMREQARQLQIALEFTGGKTGEISAVEATLTGVARSIDIESGAVSGETTIKPAFTLSDGSYGADHNLVGITGGDQTLSLAITLPSGTYTADTDLSEALADFNDDRTTARKVTVTVSDLELDDITISVASWEDVEIRTKGNGSDVSPSEEQLTIDWGTRTSTLVALEITDNDGNLYLSPVEDGKTTGLFEMPSTVASMYGYTNDNRKHNFILRIETYNLATRTLTIDPDNYLVRSASDFAKIEDMDGTYMQMNDIDMSGAPSVPVGFHTTGFGTVAFNGFYDGNGFNIKNVELTDNGTTALGLFAYNTGTLKNVHITGTVSMPSKASFAPICGINEGIIDGCTNEAAITAKEYSAGIVAINAGVVRGSANKGAVSGNNDMAGIAGRNTGSLENNTNSGKVSTTQDGAAGISATNSGNGVIKECINNGVVETAAGRMKAGGITVTNEATLQLCKNTAKVSTGTCAGGIVAVNAGLVERCINSGTGVATTSTCSGGVCGHNKTSATITSSANLAPVSGAGKVGGIVGTNEGIVSASKNTGAITSTADMTGGIVGENRHHIRAVYNTGAVSGTAQCGGIAGKSGYQITHCIIAATYNTGTVTGTATTGSILGYSDHFGEVKPSYYVEGTSALGVGGSVGSEVGRMASAFKYDAVTPANTVWPGEDASIYWGLAGSSVNPDENHSWKSLGSPATSTYPTLWWE